MPLAVGNKWYYSNINSTDDEEIRFIMEVVSVDSIYNEKVYRIKTSTFKPDTVHTYYYQRLSNDTLYKFYYNEEFNIYSKSIDAVFSLSKNQRV